MRVLLVGNGAREHALALLITGSTLQPRLSAVMKSLNPGIARVCERTGGRIYRGDPRNPDTVTSAASDSSADLVVVGPEEPLFSGVADRLREEGFTVFGPGRKASSIERDKAFARSLMWDYGIPGRLRYRAFRDPQEAAEYARNSGDVVVKPARQAGGSGVRVFAEPMEHLSRQARSAASSYAARLAGMIGSKYSDIEDLVIVEERVEGVEYTVMAVTDGSTVVALPAVQDHPHLYPWDTGPETGGMGSISGPGYVLPFLTREEYEETVRIIGMTVKALRDRLGEPYVGALSGQMMLTSLWGPTLIEYYSRFGDPEIGNLLYMLESDFLDLLDRAATGRLQGYRLRVREGVYVVSKAVAPEGYPLDRSRASGHPIEVDEALADRLGCTVLYGGVDYRGGSLVTTGSRALEVVCASSEGFEEASSRAERFISEGVRLLDGYRLIHRWDVGSEELVNARVRQASLVRRAYLRRRSRGAPVVYDWVPGRGVFVYDYSSRRLPRYGSGVGGSLG